MANPFSELFSAKTQEYALPEGYLDRTAGVESSYNPDAKNPNSSAGGLFQFIDGTARQYGLKNKFDPVEATDAAARLARDNATALRNALGRDPTAGELYLAHQQGAGGAIKLLSNPDAPAESIVGGAAARLNGGAGLTAGQLAQKWTRKIDGGVPLNPTITAAAERGRGPAADRPARSAMIAEGQMPMPQRPMADTTSADNGGVLEFLRQQAGQGQEAMPMQTTGGLGGLGGFRIPGGPAVNAPSSAAAPQRDIASMIPENRPNPLAFFGKPAQENQQAASERQGKITLAQELVKRGATPEQAIGMINSPAAMQLFLGEDGKKLEREKFEFLKENTRADNKRADDASMSAPRKILRDLGIEPGHPEYVANYKKLAGMGTGASAEVAQRKTDAEALGLTPDKPAYQSYVLTGKMPREDAQPLSATDKKAIMESDEGVMAAESAIKALKEAKVLSPKALGGVGAGWKAAIANNLPDALVPDGLVASPDQGKATVEMENLVTSNALSQMKAIFGGNPTEGERKILLDIQGSANMPDRIRQPIFDRAIALAERRLEFNKQRAGELRGNTYYKAGDRQAQPSGAPAAPAPAPSQAQQPAAVPDRAALEAEARRRGLLK
jgi:hypothetical protein